MSEDSTQKKQFREKVMYKSRYMREMSERAKNEKPMSDEEWYKTLKYFDFKCAYCGARLLEGNKLEKEHLTALCHGGMTKLGNIIPACRSCNASKHDKNWQTWYLQQPFYDRTRYAKIGTFIFFNGQVPEIGRKKQ